MREIKFRAWDKKKKKMGEPFTIIQALQMNNPYKGLEDSDRYIYLEYTELKDKNGKEIYDGDIIRITNNEWLDEEGLVKEIIWDEAWTSFMVENVGITEYEDMSVGGLFEWDCEVEIIGNIYENPELLK